jgi:gamma-glutamylcyclotransferase (GGCT)/AIG2-like uncharacterized protein YtfP
MQEPRELVFVYGTLRRGGSNHFRMDGADFITGGTVLGRMYRFSWYPGLVVDSAAGKILGEVYAVGAAQLAALDEFEGISATEIEGSEYRRVKVQVNSSNGPVNAWIWEWLGEVDENQRIAHGDWLQCSVDGKHLD